MLNNKKTSGFTLIELIVVIIILGVLAVSVYTRLSGSSGFAEYTYQARLISSLRNMQQRAMQDTRANYCFQINFDTSAPAFGAPTLSYNPDEVGHTPSVTCSTAVSYTNPEFIGTSATEMSDDGVAFPSAGLTFTYIGFDSLGRPLSDDTSNVNCASSCTIPLLGESTVNICIESQGYVHAC